MNIIQNLLAFNVFRCRVCVQETGSISFFNYYISNETVSFEYLEVCYNHAILEYLERFLNTKWNELFSDP